MLAPFMFHSCDLSLKLFLGDFFLTPFLGAAEKYNS
jgi:hypothetical protein